jgi:hypothetical protein
MRGAEQGWLLKAEWDGYSDGLCRACAPHTLGPSHISHLRRVSHPFREPLQFIVIAVMSVMSGTFPDTYGVFYMTVNRWRIKGPSRHCHGYRHREKGLGKRFSRYRDGHDAHDGPLRAYSRQGMRRYFFGSLTAST